MKTSERVENILKASHKARNSDIELLIIYMQKSGMELTPKQIEIFRKLPAMETITRIRRNLQEQGKYPADPKIEEERFKKFQAVKNSIHYEDPEKLLESKGYKVLPWGQ